MLVAGLDVGNATTEVVVAARGRDGLRPLGVAHARTRGRKGSAASLRGARALIEQAERDAGGRCELVAVCDLHPVDTVTVPLSAPADAAGVLVHELSGVRSDTPAGCGVGCGQHAPLDRLGADPPPAGGPVVASVPAAVDFEDAAARLNAALARGWRLAGVLAGGDDAVLIHNRLNADVPIVDEAEVDGLPPGAVVALEVAPAGGALTTLSDPAALADRLGFGPSQLAAVAPSARELLGRRTAALTRATGAPRAVAPAPGRLELAGAGAAPRALPLDAALADALRELEPGQARALVLALGRGRERRIAIRDAWTADLRAVDHAGWLRRGLARLDRAPLAALIASDAPRPDQLAAALGRPVRLAGVEACAAAAGARTTPGVPADALVLDVGGGTIDLALPGATAGASSRVPAGVVGTPAPASVSVAGAGELLTAAVAAALGLPRALGERVKRGPALQVATPHLAHHEDGSRRFLSPPVDGRAVGHLAIDDDGVLTPFARGLAAEEWRALRYALKEQVLGANVARCLRAAPAVRGGAAPGTLLVAGGGALDHEVVAMIGERLRGDGWVVARADVAGRFGPRFAVAWGALLTAGAEVERVAA